MKVTIHFSVYEHHNSILFNVKDVANEIRGQSEKHRNNIDLEVNIGNQVTYGQIDSFMNQLLISLNINPENKRRTNNIAFGETVKTTCSSKKYIFSFHSKKIRDLFYENFVDMIK